jgi:transcriptional regulator with XRE-family HTH domain
MLGQTLQRLRRAKNLSQELVAARAKLSREYISLVERDIHSPTVDALIRICRALGIKPSDFMLELEKPAHRRHRSS